MTQELEVYNAQTPARHEDTMPVRELLNMQAKIMQVMQEVMKPGTHFGEIPGCPKAVLFQPGAEKLLETFRLAAYHHVEDISTGTAIRYRVRCEIRSIMTGAVLGDEWGECSSDEDKYAWRGAICEAEFNATPADLRRLKWSKGYKGAADFTKQQIRTNPADSANTILAMACKRAKVRAARAALAASDLFDVNIEDLPDEIREEYFGDQATTDKPKATSAAVNRHQNPQQEPPQQHTADAKGDPTLGAYVIPFGKNKGRTLEDIGPNSARWYAEECENATVKAAARAWLDSRKDPADKAKTDAPPPATAEPEGPLPEDISDPFADQ